ncbi:MAG: hypothetical protein LUG65_02545, partial [Clostridiales bacterium]|nr:hypothetical protein [Clostridiales bacterium]
MALLFAFSSGGVCAWLFLRRTDGTADSSRDEADSVRTTADVEEPAAPEMSADTKIISDTETDGEGESASASEAEADPTYAAAERLLVEMTLEEKIYQMFIVTPEQLTGSDATITQSGEETRAALEAKPVGGIVYMGGNLETRDQVMEMIAAAQSYSKYGLFIAVDEEGGRVARFGNNVAMGTTSFPAMLELSAQGTDAVQSAMTTIGTEIGAFGVNLD